MGAITNEEKVDFGLVADRRCRIEHGGEIVRAAEVAGVAYDEFPTQVPFRAQIARARNRDDFGLGQGPVVNDAELGRRHALGAQARGHALAEHDVCLR